MRNPSQGLNNLERGWGGVGGDSILYKDLWITYLIGYLKPFLSNTPRPPQQIHGNRKENQLGGGGLLGAPNLHQITALVCALNISPK